MDRSHPPANWLTTLWRGEEAWASHSSGVLAVVSGKHSRLVYLGAADGSANLLHSPLAGNPGGHRFWLGPQHLWGWPPPADWEDSAAISAEAVRGVLSLHHARRDPSFPALAREYSWEGNHLRCTVHWEDDGRPRFGMHILAVNTPFEITVRLETSAAAPEGMVLARIIDPEPAIQLPHPAVIPNGTHATVRAGIREAKFGFTRQSLAVGRPGDWSLAMHPGPEEGSRVGQPDDGYLSQVWVGDGSSDFSEVEQLSPFLRGDATGGCSSTVFIEAIPSG